MKALSTLTPLCALALLSACGGGGGGGGAAADAGLLPGAARYSLDVADLDEALVASSHGTAFPFDHFLAGQFLTVGGTETALWQATLDEDGEPVAAHRAEVPGPFFNLALISGSVEHRGTEVGYSSVAHLWGGGRQADGGWCAVIDEAGPYTIVDTVLFATGGMGALLQAADAGSGGVLLAYEEYDADGTQVLAVDLPGPFLSGTICSIGLVTSPDGVEWPVVAATKTSNLLTWVGTIDRGAAEVSITATTTVTPTSVTELEVVDAPGARSAWIVGTRVTATGTRLLEAIEIHTEDEAGQQLPDGPAVAQSDTVGFAVAGGYQGFDFLRAIHGREIGGQFEASLFLCGETEDTALAEDKAAWFAWEGGAVSATWVRVAVDVGDQIGSVLMEPAGTPGQVAAAAVVSNLAGFSSVVTEFDVATGELVMGSYYDTEFFVQEMQPAGSGLLLRRVGGTPLTVELEGVRGDLTADFGALLIDGPGDTLPEIEGLQRAYADRGLVAGGSDQGLYVINVLDPAARAQASAVLTDLPPVLGPEEAFFSSTAAVVGIGNQAVPQGTEALVPAAPRLVPQAVVPMGIEGSEL